ncbi:putative Late nodulin [Medicago truncatula]|uniref:Nodule Cysteine-Rich (NCR) secreted peptide n=1 Tax=Medicago truncatula TaxID=3880 RepID=A0A072VHI2_MEDTR|nr:Nodule Cysteine-Rich (NCR) secreted peptide [Medicago truncatula]RHN79032.1 putative Late nodulin [Medicago truncatula]
MAEIVKYVYVIIIFLSLFLVAMNIEGKFHRCFKDSECLNLLYCRTPLKPKCMYRTFCKCKVVFTSNVYVLT